MGNQMENDFELKDFKSNLDKKTGVLHVEFKIPNPIKYIFAEWIVDSKSNDEDLNSGRL